MYGEAGFFHTDTLRMAMEEVVDLSNYARYTFIKLYVLQRALGIGMDETVSTGTINDTEDSGFKSIKDMWGK